jgi:hypothetical protein
MAQGTGAGGFLGVALEATAGTYAEPTKFVPIQSESLAFTQDTVWRRPIRQSADIVGAVEGNGRVEGDISMEAFEDVVATMLQAARTTMTTSGTSPNFIYTFTGTPDAVPSQTMSITVVRNEQVFAYTGCVLASFVFTIDDGALMFNPTILGRDEAEQDAPTATWGTGIQSTPYGQGQYKISIPTGTQVYDADSFEFTVDDGAEAQYRLRDDTNGASFVSFGERAVTLSLDRDFLDRDDYDAFRALTAQSVTLLASKGANNSISIAIPAAVKDTYEVGLSGQGDLIRASIAYNGVLDSTGKAYTIAVATQEDFSG